MTYTRAPHGARTLRRAWPALTVGSLATLLFVGVGAGTSLVRDEVVIQPGDDIPGKVAGAPPGTTFRIRPGLYRTQPITPKDGDTFIGDRGAVLSGAIAVTGFTRQGGNWAAPVSITRGVVKGQCLKDSPLCGAPEDLYIDDQLVAHASSASRGRFALDYDAGRVSIADDPGAHRVELAVVPRAFTGSAAKVTIRGLIIEKFAAIAQDAAIHGDNTTDWLIDHNELRWNHSAAIKLGRGMRVSQNNIHHNGQEGIGAYKSVGAVIEGNEIAYNNTVGFDPQWEAGGTKFSGTDHLIVRGNRVHHNHGKGLWTDVDNINTLYDSNTVTDNTDQGIFHEISYDAVISHNDCERNGFGNANTSLSGAGILVASSSNVEIFGNTVIGNGNGIGARQEQRSGKSGSYDVKNLYVHDNLIAMDVGMTGLVVQGGDMSVYTSRNNRFVNDTYRLPNPSARAFWWKNAAHTLAEWQGMGMDTPGAAKTP